MMAMLRNLGSVIERGRDIAERIGAPLLLLVIRLFVANIFFQSGLLKFQNFLNDDWGATVYLFEEVHPVPGVPPAVAAVAGTAGELGLSALLALGLLGRFGAAGLIIMTCVIQFLVPASYGIANPEHYYWILLLAVIVINGPGRLSLDALVAGLIRRAQEQERCLVLPVVASDREFRR